MNPFLALLLGFRAFRAFRVYAGYCPDSVIVRKYSEYEYIYIYIYICVRPFVAQKQTVTVWGQYPRFRALGVGVQSLGV